MSTFNPLDYAVEDNTKNKSDLNQPVKTFNPLDYGVEQSVETNQLSIPESPTTKTNDLINSIIHTAENITNPAVDNRLLNTQISEFGEPAPQINNDTQPVETYAQPIEKESLREKAQGIKEIAANMALGAAGFIPSGVVKGGVIGTYRLLDSLHLIPEDKKVSDEDINKFKGLIDKSLNLGGVLEPKTEFGKKGLKAIEPVFKEIHGFVNDKTRFIDGKKYPNLKEFANFAGEAALYTLFGIGSEKAKLKAKEFTKTVETIEKVSKHDVPPEMMKDELIKNGVDNGIANDIAKAMENRSVTATVKTKVDVKKDKPFVKKAKTFVGLEESKPIHINKEYGKTVDLEVEKLKQLENTTKNKQSQKQEIKDPEIKSFIDNKIQELGNLDTVKKLYNDLKSPADVYARQKAAEIYGGDSGVKTTVDVFNKVKNENEKDIYAIKGKGFDTQKGKVIPWKSARTRNQHLQQDAMRAGRDISEYTTFDDKVNKEYTYQLKNSSDLKPVNIEKDKELKSIDIAKEFGTKKVVSESDKNKIIDKYVDQKYGSIDSPPPQPPIDAVPKYPMQVNVPEKLLKGDQNKAVHKNPIEKSKTSIQSVKVAQQKIAPKTLVERVEKKLNKWQNAGYEVVGKEILKNKIVPYKLKHFAVKKTLKLGKKYEVKPVMGGYIIKSKLPKTITEKSKIDHLNLSSIPKKEKSPIIFIPTKPIELQAKDLNIKNYYKDKDKNGKTLYEVTSKKTGEVLYRNYHSSIAKTAKALKSLNLVEPKQQKENISQASKEIKRLAKPNEITTKGNNQRREQTLGEKSLSDSKKSKGIVLNSGVDPVFLVKQITTLVKDRKNFLPELENLGRVFYTDNRQKYFHWQKSMKKVLGNIWEKVKEYIEKVWKVVKKPISNERGNILLPKKVQKEIKKVGKSLDYALGSLNTRLANIDPSIKNRMVEFELDSNSKIEKVTKAVLPFIEKTQQMSKADYKEFDLARKNSDTKVIDKLIKKYHMSEEYQDLRDVLDSLRKEAISAGYDVKYKQNYHPRDIKNTNEYLDYLYGTDKWSMIREVLKKKETKIGKQLTKEEKIQLINSLYRGFADERLTLSKPGQLKSRKVLKINKKENKYYSDSNSALLRYISDVVTAVEIKKFFNQGKGGFGDDLDTSIGKYILDLSESGKISPSQEVELRSMLKARFKPQATKGIVTTFKNLAIIDVMGSFTSAARQIGDIAWSLNENGIVPTVGSAPKAMIGKSNFTKEDLGISKIGAEFSDKTKTAKWVDSIFKYTFLTKIDAVGKEILINAAFQKASKQARNIRKVKILEKELTPIFKNKTKEVISDLANKRKTRNAKLYILHKLLTYQPAVLSELPQGFIEGGNYRILYMLKSFDIKKLDIYRTQVFQQIAKPKSRLKGFKNLIKLGFFIALMEASGDTVINFMLGRKVSYTKAFMQNLYNLIMTRYRANRIEKVGLGKALLEQTLPPTQLIDSLTKDINTALSDKKHLGINTSEAIKSIPLVGKLYYNRIGLGKTKRNYWNKINKTKSKSKNHLRRRKRRIKNNFRKRILR